MSTRFKFDKEILSKIYKVFSTRIIFLIFPLIFSFFFFLIVPQGTIVEEDFRILSIRTYVV